MITETTHPLQNQNQKAFSRWRLSGAAGVSLDEFPVKSYCRKRWRDGAIAFAQAQRKEITKNISIKKEALEKELSEEIQKIEVEIQELRNKAPEKINKIAMETSADLLQQLIGVDVNSSSISAIVDDLSRKKMAKYYGN